MAATIGPGGTSYGGLSCHKWSPGLTMAAIIGPQRGGLTVAGADQLWQPQSVRGEPFMAREIAIAGPPGPISAADHPLRDSPSLYVSACAYIL